MFVKSFKVISIVNKQMVDGAMPICRAESWPLHLTFCASGELTGQLEVQRFLQAAFCSLELGAHRYGEHRFVVFTTIAYNWHNVYVQPDSASLTRALTAFTIGMAISIVILDCQCSTHITSGFIPIVKLELLRGHPGSCPLH